MKYSSVIFDWDGTLGMTLHLWFEGYKSELKKLGREYSDQVIIDDFFYEHKKTMLKYPDMDFDAFIENVRKYMISHVSHMKLYEGVHETLEKLQENNIKLALVSSSPRKLLEEVLELTDLSKFFSAVEFHNQAGILSPEVENFSSSQYEADIAIFIHTYSFNGFPQYHFFKLFLFLFLHRYLPFIIITYLF